MRRLAALTGLLLAGCGGGGGSPQAVDTRPAPDEAAEIRRLLDARGRALAAGDARGLAATTVAALRTRQRLHARRARAIGVRAARYEIPPPEIDGSRARVAATLVYSLRGVAGEFSSRVSLRLVRSRGGWLVSEARARRQRVPWEVGAYRRVAAPHFVVLAPAGIDPRAAGLLDALEAGYDRIRAVVNKPRLRRRYLVVVARGAGDARRLTAAIQGLAGLAALTDTEVREQGPAERVTEVASQRLLVIWSAFLALDAEQRTTVVAHELTHAAVAPATSGRTPAWLVEGLALYVSGDRRVAEAATLVTASSASRSVLSLSGLNDPDAIGRIGGAQQTAAYAYASAAAHYVADRFGREKLLALYDAFNDESLEGAAGDLALTDAAVRRELRLPLARLERDLRRWIVTRAVVSPFSP